MTAIETRRRREGLSFLVLFALTIPAANWLIGHAGTVCLRNGPCLIPVAPGVLAPSGVTMAGIAMVLRDLVQRRLGVAAASLAILFGAALSALLAPPALVLASATAFLLSEFAPISRSIPRSPAAAWSWRSRRRARSGSLWIRSCSCGSPSARSISWLARSS
jgi:queuosine precursor transporter